MNSKKAYNIILALKFQYIRIWSVGPGIGGSGPGIVVVGGAGIVVVGSGIGGGGPGIVVVGPGIVVFLSLVYFIP